MFDDYNVIKKVGICFPTIVFAGSYVRLSD